MIAKQLSRALVAMIASCFLASVAQSASASFTGTLTIGLSNGEWYGGAGVPGDIPVCSSSGSIRYMYLLVGQNGVTAEGFKNLFATALAGFAAEKTVDIIYDDSSQFCYVNRLLIR